MSISRHELWKAARLRKDGSYINEEAEQITNRIVSALI